MVALSGARPEAVRSAPGSSGSEIRPLKSVKEIVVRLHNKRPDLPNPESALCRVVRQWNCGRSAIRLDAPAGGGRNADPLSGTRGKDCGVSANPR
jgi:hypothetical protein